jgi:hypothetical protein
LGILCRFGLRGICSPLGGAISGSLCGGGCSGCSLSGGLRGGNGFGCTLLWGGLAGLICGSLRLRCRLGSGIGLRLSVCRRLLSGGSGIGKRLFYIL